MKLESSVTLFNDNKVEDRFAELQVTADGITAEVGRKVGNDEVISRINLSPETATIQVDKINIDGVITAVNDNTTTTIDGDKITTGTLLASAVKVDSGTFNTANIPATARNDTYITDIGSDGIRVHDSHTSDNSIVINSSGMEVFKGGAQPANSVAFYGDTARVGKSSTRHIEIKDGGMQVYQDASASMAHIGYGNGTSESGTASAPYYTFGNRGSGAVGNYSLAEGIGNIASAPMSHAEGKNTTASGNMSHAEGAGTVASSYEAHAEGHNTTASAQMTHAEGESTTASKDYAHAEGYSTTASGVASHAEGSSTTASGNNSHAEGYVTTASGYASHASGRGTWARGEAQTVVGKYNATDTTSLFIVGKGTSSADSDRSNAFVITNTGNATLAGTLTQGSDRRLKEHLAYLGEEAIDFVDSLKPAHYIKDGEHHVGFYAQDVEEVDKWQCMVGEMNGYKTLSYTELIAPLVAYCQHLEKRIEDLERSR